VEAAKWYRKAADQNEAEAQCRLGHAYAEGHGVEAEQASLGERAAVFARITRDTA